MDVDAFIAGRDQAWRRMDQLASRRSLNVDEADELVRLYRQSAADLALVRSRTPDPATITRLSLLVARARSKVVSTPTRGAWQALMHGVTVSFPVTVYRSWRWWGSIWLVNILFCLGTWVYLGRHPERVGRVLGDENVRQLVDHDFADYYRSGPAGSFALHVWVNNALVAAGALFLGVTVVGAVFLLFQNALNLGVIGAAMINAGKGDVFFGLILPHGLLELTAVFVAGGAGLQMGWAWIAPGRLPRGRALAQAGRSAVTVALGLVVVLAVCGFNEAFVTPSGLPTAMRVGIGVFVEVLFLAYVIVFGRRGVSAGETGDVGVGDREDYAPVA